MSHIELSKQKLDIDQMISALRARKQDIEYQIKTLVRGIEELENGEDMLASESLLAQEVRKIMRQ